MKKIVRDLTSKHFSRYGEFLVSFELAKHEWNVYSPMYDEYIDLIIHKFSCSSCGKAWKVTPLLICNECKKDFSKTQKSKIIANKICSKCGYQVKGNTTKCPECKNDMVSIPGCNNCGHEVEIVYHKCECGHIEYQDKMRTIQVKSSRIEQKDGVSKNTYAVDLKPKDMITSPNHLFIWCLIDNYDRPNFLVMTVDDFKETMGDSMKGASFLKDQDRQHFSSKDFGKWGKFLNAFSKLE